MAGAIGAGVLAGPAVAAGGLAGVGVVGQGTKGTAGVLGCLTGEGSLLDLSRSLNERWEGLITGLGTCRFCKKENSCLGLEGPGVPLAFSFPLEDWSGRELLSCSWLYISKGLVWFTPRLVLLSTPHLNGTLL
jgi:hypothetical protein